MSQAKVPSQNRQLRQSQGNRLTIPCNFFTELPLTKPGWLELEPAYLAIPIEVTPIITGMMMTMISMSVIPVVRPVISVRIIITVGIVAVVARKSETNTEVNSSIRARCPSDHQPPGYKCYQQKFLHYFTSELLNSEIELKVAPLLGGQNVRITSQADSLSYPFILNIAQPQRIRSFVGSMAGERGHWSSG